MSNHPPRPLHRGTAVAVVGLTALGVTAAPLWGSAAAQGTRLAGTPTRQLLFASPLSDLQPAAPAPVDGARAQLRLTFRGGSTVAVLTVRDLARSARGTTYGAHLHSGPCVPGDGAAAGPHYNAATPPVPDARHEIWLDFTVDRHGVGRARTVVPFVPAHGTRSIVVHEMATDHHTGAAGARLACMPVVW